MKTLPIQPVRKIVQYSFLALIVLIGVQFALFVNQLEKGLLPTVTRPPGIEGFLPISSLISFKYWLVTGIFNPIHPSGLIIFLYLNRLHRLIFRKDIRVPRWLDYPLRSLKYLLLFFFIWAIIIKMNVRDLDYFIYSNAALFYRYLRFRFLGAGGIIGFINFNPQLLVPLPLPLWCPFRRTQFYQYL
jgi:hypothetical protein